MSPGAVDTAEGAVALPVPIAGATGATRPEEALPGTEREQRNRELVREAGARLKRVVTRTLKRRGTPPRP